MQERADFGRVDEPRRAVVDGARHADTAPRIAEPLDAQQRQRDLIRARAVRKQTVVVQPVATVDEPARAARVLVEQAEPKLRRRRFRIEDVRRQPHDVVDALRAVKQTRHNTTIWQSNTQPQQ
jgi:hypothetical protein